VSTSLQEIKGWFQRAKADGATHLIVVCDTFDHEDFPVYVYENVEAVLKQHQRAEMQRVMEVYKISLGWEAQAKGRVWNV
jgi:hypothetical protein